MKRLLSFLILSITGKILIGILILSIYLYGFSPEWMLFGTDKTNPILIVGSIICAIVTLIAMAMLLDFIWTEKKVEPQEDKNKQLVDTISTAVKSQTKDMSAQIEKQIEIMNEMMKQLKR